MTTAPARHEHAALMDGVYRLQRHIYDATRKYYLLGRDGLLADVATAQPGSVLEVATGTGRNLMHLAGLVPHSRLYGFDISRAMLEKAQASARRAGLSGRVRFAQGDATQFDAAAAFGRSTFDAVFISYALSMIPDWRAALQESWRLTAPGGTLAIVDFADQSGWPAPARAALRAWLRRFHVTPRGGLEDAAHALPGVAGIGTRRAHGDYCVTVRLIKAA
ncbi:MAG: class I SAM-dependent methyltransferase [Rhizobiaceae bacterium]|nr:class I SAM-dependent methyltransferase [Rhizobiaceae bacterium]